MNYLFDKNRFSLVKTKFHFKDSFPLDAVLTSTSRYQSLKEKKAFLLKRISFSIARKEGSL